MIWGAFSAQGTAQLCFCAPRTNAEMYTDMLGDALVPYLEDNMGGDASIDAARHTQEWLAVRGIPVLEWPACSPDLNPIENLWAILARRVYRKPSGKRVFMDFNALKAKIVQEWANLDIELLSTLHRPMPNRIFEAIKKMVAQIATRPCQILNKIELSKTNIPQMLIIFIKILVIYGMLL